MLCAASAEKARCLPSRRAVSRASCVWRARRVALSLMRSASVRRAAPCGRAASRWRARSASRSSSAQRAPRICTPSRSSCSWAEPPAGARPRASCKWLSRVARSCSAWELSATTMFASAFRCRPWGTFSPAAASVSSLTRADRAALRERMKRPASMWVRASSIALCMARSFCCTRHRRAWWGNSSRAASARSAAYTVTKLVTSSSTTMFREKSMR